MVGFGTNQSGEFSDRLGCVREAMARVSEFADVVSTSSLYESAPMYKEDQPRFLNGVFQVVTSLPALDLLKKLKAVEASMGRPLDGRTLAGSGVQNGPRVMDLDILMEEPTIGAEEAVGNYVRWQRVADPENLSGRGILEVPHPLLHERPFALAPLMDVAPDALIDRAGSAGVQREGEGVPRGGTAPQRPLHVWEMYRGCMAAVLSAPGSAAGAWGGGWESEDTRGPRALHCAGLIRVLPVPTLRETGRNDALWPLGWRTYVMGVLNVTPDSFSDGGRYHGAGGDGGGGVEAAIAHAKRMVAEGADVIDIGGQSTRPGAEHLDPGEELRRVLPVMRALAAALPELNRIRDGVHAAQVPAAYLGHDGGDGVGPTGVALSLDTFHGSVVESVAEICPVLVNDVSNGRDPELLKACAKHRLPLVLNHARGTPKTMGGMTDYSAEGRGEGEPADNPLLRRDRGLVQGVATELGVAAERAMAAGVEGWGIVADPGLGFAKTHPQCAQLVRELPRLRRDRYWPVLVGASRKGFLGTLAGRHQQKTPEDAVARDPAGLAALTASVAGGTDLVRVHDVHPAVDAARVSDGIFRSHGYPDPS